MYWLDRLQREEASQRVPKTFPLIRVSERAQQLVLEVENAASGMATAPVKEIETAYGFVNRGRSALYKYIETLERKAGVKRTVNLRFD